MHSLRLRHSIAVTAIVAITAMSCKNTDTVPPLPAHEAPSGAHATVVIGTHAASTVGIRVERVTLHGLGTALAVPATVVPSQQGLAHVGALVPGRVSALLVQEGSVVAKGQPLATLEGPEIWEMYASLARTNAELLRAEGELKRQQTLAAEHIGSAHALQEAEAAAALARSAFQAADKRLHAIGVSDADVQATLREAEHRSTALAVCSPIAGTVAKRFAALGEYVEPSKDLFEVIDARTVWVDAAVPPREAERVASGDTVHFVTPHGDSIRGRVIHVSPILDDATRSLTVRAEVQNAGGALRPASFGTLVVAAPSARSNMSVPVSAIIDEQGSSSVFVRQGDSVYARVPVTCGQRGNGRVEIVDGLRDGDDVVTEGVFYLKSAVKRDQLRTENE